MPLGLAKLESLEPLGPPKALPKAEPLSVPKPEPAADPKADPPALAKGDAAPSAPPKADVEVAAGLLALSLAALEGCGLAKLERPLLLPKAPKPDVEALERAPKVELLNALSEVCGCSDGDLVSAGLLYWDVAEVSSKPRDAV